MYKTQLLRSGSRIQLKVKDPFITGQRIASLIKCDMALELRKKTNLIKWPKKIKNCEKTYRNEMLCDQYP